VDEFVGVIPGDVSSDGAAYADDGRFWCRPIGKSLVAAPKPHVTRSTQALKPFPAGFRSGR
jgi:hypothetical protein